MNLIERIREHQIDASTAYDNEADAYYNEHYEEPNWDSPVIWTDGESVGWYWGGDAALDNEHRNHVRFRPDALESEIREALQADCPEQEQEEVPCMNLGGCAGNPARGCETCPAFPG